ncbi:hypothetical protein MJH12_04090, partial [bacterium]|nr:hypothetical protein [bacterium]
MKKIALFIAALMGAFVLFLFIYIRTLDMSSIRNLVKSQIDEQVNGQVEIGELSISGLRSVVIKDILLIQDGKKSLSLDSLVFELSLIDLIQSKLSFSTISLSGLDIYIRRVGQEINFLKLLKVPLPLKKSNKKTLSMVATSGLAPLQIESIKIDAAKVYFDEIHLFAFELEGSLRDGKLIFPKLSVEKDHSYIHSKLFYELASNSGVFEIKESLIKLHELALIAHFEKSIPQGDLEILGDLSFKGKEVHPQFALKIPNLVLAQNQHRLTFEPIEVLIQKDEV